MAKKYLARIEDCEMRVDKNPYHGYKKNKAIRIGVYHDGMCLFNFAIDKKEAKAKLNTYCFAGELVMEKISKFLD